jgi:hypothetical protein
MPTFGISETGLDVGYGFTLDPWTTMTAFGLHRMTDLTSVMFICSSQVDLSGPGPRFVKLSELDV